MTMQKGKIGVTSENLFPIIKKFLYSDSDIFLREMVSNAVDATQKLKALALSGDYKGELGDLTVRIKLDKENGTITISDRGIGMTAEEINKYINEIAFTSANEFLDKYKDNIDAIIGHFGLGFYSAFMVSNQVDIISKSYQEGATPVKWSCKGDPEYTLEETEKEDRGTDIVLHIDEDSQDFLDENKIEELLNKYCKFLPVKIAFGKEKETDENGNQVETDKDHIINDTNPIWKRSPSELKDEDYNEFYRKLYPGSEDPLFHIHLNVDYPFNLTGVLYFPKIRNNVEIQKNKIQLYANQVFVTDSVDDIVPEFLTLLHGVIDSPDIPLNVSRSYLQNDASVKKISSHINKKVADRLNDIFKNDRKDFENKWDDIKIFIQYGMLSDDKFYERTSSFALLKNTEGKYFTFDEYKDIIKDNQADKDNNVVYLYATDKDSQYSYIEAAKEKGYDVLLMDGQLDTHFVNQLEQKFESASFQRVDADVIDNLIKKEDKEDSGLDAEQQNQLTPIFKSHINKDGHFVVTFEKLSENDQPAMVTQSEFMRRMKDMSQMGGGMSMYGQLPDSYNLVVNTQHPLLQKIVQDKDEKIGDKVSEVNNRLTPVKEEKEKLEQEQQDKKDEDLSQEQKDKLEEKRKELEKLENEKEEILKNYGKENSLVKQVVDLALLASNMLKGEDLDKFVKRSVELIKE